MYRLLIIEDDLDFAEVLVESLQEEPFFEIMDIVTNLEDAKRHLYSGALHNIDAALVDLNLVQSTTDRHVQHAGVGLIQEMRKTHGFTGKILVLTNSTNAHDVRDAFDAGADGFLTKCIRPRDIPELLVEIRMVVAGSEIVSADEMKHVFLKSDLLGNSDTFWQNQIAL